MDTLRTESALPWDAMDGQVESVLALVIMLCLAATLLLAVAWTVSAIRRRYQSERQRRNAAANAIAKARVLIIMLVAVAGIVLAFTPGSPLSVVNRIPAPWLDSVSQVLDEARTVLTSPVPWTVPDAPTPVARSPARARTVKDFGPCEPARVELAGVWEPTSTFEYFPADPPQAHPRRRGASIAGLHETAERRDVRIELELRCLDERCQVCVSSVTGRIGYEPSRLSLRADLEDNPCVRSHVLAHEQRHADVTRRAEARVLSRAREMLGWAERPHPGHFVAWSKTDDGERDVHSQIEDVLERAHADAFGYARRAHSFIDSDREAALSGNVLVRSALGSGLDHALRR